ncbi:Kinase [Hexamita inflata]|uniref:non-specific serine/threonine protein kinase n=1 Tax=Hexamita inflata TaxID=28002 RepID=A0AA86QP26_9EUKA|nr:CAMK CAMKL [Hexamita inflata]
MNDTQNIKIRSSGSHLYINEYELVSFLGKGTSSTVYKCKLLNEEFALMISQQPYYNQKQVTDQLIDLQCSKIIRTFKVNEIQINMSQQHKIYFGDSIIQSGIDQYIAICTYISGNSFDNNLTFTMKLEVIMKHFRQFCVQIKKMHSKNVFHFDIKPEHLILDKDKYQIIDFSSSVIINEQHNINADLLTHSYKTTQYAASSPLFSTQVFKNSIICEKQDVYALGCVLYKNLMSQCRTKPLNRNSQTFQNIKMRFNELIADLLSGMLDGEQVYRYTMNQVINHPAMFPESNIKDLILFQFEYVSILNKLMFKNALKQGSIMRSFSTQNRINQEDDEIVSSRINDDYFLDFVKQNTLNQNVLQQHILNLTQKQQFETINNSSPYISFSVRSNKHSDIHSLSSQVQVSKSTIKFSSKLNYEYVNICDDSSNTSSTLISRNQSNVEWQFSKDNITDINIETDAKTQKQYNLRAQMSFISVPSCMDTNDEQISESIYKSDCDPLAFYEKSKK